METTIDEEGNLLVVRASAEVQSQIKILLKELDRLPADAEKRGRQGLAGGCHERALAIAPMVGRSVRNWAISNFRCGVVG